MAVVARVNDLHRGRVGPHKGEFRCVAVLADDVVGIPLHAAVVFRAAVPVLHLVPQTHAGGIFSNEFWISILVV